MRQLHYLIKLNWTNSLSWPWSKFLSLFSFVERSATLPRRSGSGTASTTALAINNNNDGKAFFQWKYSQTWVNDHLWITTTCLQRPLFWGLNFNFHNVNLPLNNDHLSTTATNFGSRGCSLYTSLTEIVF